MFNGLHVGELKWSELRTNTDIWRLAKSSCVRRGKIGRQCGHGRLHSVSVARDNQAGKHLRVFAFISIFENTECPNFVEMG